MRHKARPKKTKKHKIIDLKEKLKIIREREAGATTEQLCRDHLISNSSVFRIIKHNKQAPNTSTSCGLESTKNMKCESTLRRITNRKHNKQEGTSISCDLENNRINNKAGTKEPKKKRKVIPLEEKLRIIVEREAGATIKQICRDHLVCAATVQRIMNRKKQEQNTSTSCGLVATRNIKTDKFTPYESNGRHNIKTKEKRKLIDLKEKLKIIREREAGATTAQLCRDHLISQSTMFRIIKRKKQEQNTSTSCGLKSTKNIKCESDVKRIINRKHNKQEGTSKCDLEINLMNNKAGTKGPKKKRKIIPLEEKLRIIAEREAGTTIKQICRDHLVCVATVQRIMNRKKQEQNTSALCGLIPRNITTDKVTSHESTDRHNIHYYRKQEQSTSTSCGLVTTRNITTDKFTQYESTDRPNIHNNYKKQEQSTSTSCGLIPTRNIKTTTDVFTPYEFTDHHNIHRNYKKQEQSNSSSCGLIPTRNITTTTDVFTPYESTDQLNVLRNYKKQEQNTLTSYGLIPARNIKTEIFTPYESDDFKKQEESTSTSWSFEIQDMKDKNFNLVELQNLFSDCDDLKRQVMNIDPILDRAKEVCLKVDCAIRCYQDVFKAKLKRMKQLKITDYFCIKK